MLRAILKKAAAIDLSADGAPPVTARIKLALFRNRWRAQGQRNRLQMASVRNDRAMLPTNEHLAPDDARALLEHPLQVWLERAVVHYLRDQASAGASADRRDGAWWLRWPDGQCDDGVVFDAGTADARRNALTLEDGRMRGLIAALPHWAAGLPVPCVQVPGLPATVVGLWSLWQIGLSTDAGDGAGPSKRRFLPVFQSDEGRVFMPTARRVWDLVLTETLAAPSRLLKGTDANEALVDLLLAGLRRGEPVLRFFIPNPFSHSINVGNPSLLLSQ